MPSRLPRCGALAAALLCLLGRPAFADGAIPSAGAVYGAFIVVVLVVGGVLALLIRAIIRTDRRDAAARKQPPADPPSPLPTARVVRDRDEPS